MNKTYKLDFLTTLLLFIMLTVYIYTFIIFGGTATLNLLLRYVFLVFITLLFLLVITKNLLSKNKIIFLLPAILFTIINAIRIETIDAQTIVSVLIQTSFIMLMYILCIVIWNKQQIWLFNWLALLIFPLFLVALFFDMVNTNTIGGYTYFLTFFPLLYLIGYSKNLTHFRVLLIISFSISIIYFSDTRSIFLSVIFSLVTYLLWKVITRKKLWFYCYFFLILVFNFVVTVLYPKLYLLKNFHKYNMLSMEYTGKNLLSGRNVIWDKLTELIMLKPYFGYGAGVNPQNFINSDLSAHNLYIQISLQIGLIGLSFLLLFFFFIWRAFWNNRYDPKVILSSCYFIGILIYQLFEVTLTQNNFGLGLLQWIIIGLGLSYVFNKDKLKLQ